jgi:REP element-mobilizing transposase RayT
MDVPQRKVWHSRGYLPHFDVPGLTQMITFRLIDSMPKEKLLQLQDQLRHIPQLERRKIIESHLDAGYGSCLLRNPEAAAIMQDTLLHFDGERYKLLAWVVMPNHVHGLIETNQFFSLSQIVKSWKGYTANQINKLFGRSGPFWEPDYFDRYVRDRDHLANAINYIHLNPVKARLCEREEDWLFSSAALYTTGSHLSGG